MPFSAIYYRRFPNTGESISNRMNAWQIGMMYRMMPGSLCRLSEEEGRLLVDYSMFVPRAALAHGWSFEPASASFPGELLPIIVHILNNEKGFHRRDL